MTSKNIVAFKKEITNLLVNIFFGQQAVQERKLRR